MCLSKNIRYLRKKKNYSQDKIAELLGYKSYTTIQKWEMGISEPPLVKLKKLSEIFNVDINDLATKKMYESDLYNGSQILNKSDKKEIDDYIEDMKCELMKSESLMFDGEPAEQEDIETILNAMRIGAEMVKKKNKERFTPKKYRK